MPTLRNRIAPWLTLTLGSILIVVSVGAALYLAHRQVVDTQSQQSSEMARDLLQRSEAMGTQALAAYQLLHDTAKGDPCSEDAMRRMRDIAMRDNYLEAVGVVRNGRLECSSFGRYGEGLELGPVSYVSTLGAKIRPSVDLGLSNGHRFLVLQKDIYAAAVHPATLLDVFPGNRDTSFGLFGASSGVAMGHSGKFDPAWARRLGNRREAVIFENGFLVAVRRSERFDMAAYVAIPGAALGASLDRLMKILVPLGLLLGLALALCLFLLARRHNSLPATLRAALRRREFVLHYQPVVDLESGRMVGVEALLRWQRRDGSGLRPSVFIPVAEEDGLIGRFTEYVLAHVAEDAPAFLARHPECYITINLSSDDLHGERIIALLQQLLAAPGMKPGNLMVEVTEYGLLDTHLASPNIAKIRAMGIRVAIDDFGTGFSNLSHLATLDIDCVKIDKLFVETGGSDSPTSHVALHIIEVARELKLEVVAEGVETEFQARFLREHGVRYAQGWLYEKALSMDQLLRSWRWCPPPPEELQRRA